jgi:hypothetical protein
VSNNYLALHNMALNHFFAPNHFFLTGILFLGILFLLGRFAFRRELFLRRELLLIPIDSIPKEHEQEWTESLIIQGGQHTRFRGKARFARATNPTPNDTTLHDPKLWVATGEPRPGHRHGWTTPGR